MLRLDLRDKGETVMFIDPMKGVRIRKGETLPQYELCIETDSAICYASYDSEEYRDAVYEYALNKVNEYLFPQIESVELGPVCPNDAAMPEYLCKPKEV